MKTLQYLILGACLSFAHLSLAQCPTSSSNSKHVVQKGETLYRISKYYNVSLQDITSWNNISVGDILPLCTELTIKSPQRAIRMDEISPSSLSSNPDYAGAVAYEAAEAYVGHLDELTPKGIATNTTSLNNTSLYAKQNGLSHEVMPGQTIAGIAELYGYTESRFRTFNGLSANQQIPVGTLLRANDCTCPEGRSAYNYPVQYSNESPLPTTQTYKEKDVSTDTSIEYPEAIEPTASNELHPKGNPSGIATEGLKSEAKETKSPPSLYNATILQQKQSIINLISIEEMSMVNEINLLRSNPADYIVHVQEYMANLLRTGSTKNDSAYKSAKELLTELQETAPLTQLTVLPCLYQAAIVHGKDEKLQGSSNHMGSDGSWPWDRALKHCDQLKDGNENLVGGPSSIKEAVMLLLVDDGIPSRGHRKTLLNPEWEYVACYKVGQIGQMPNSWIQMFGY